MIIRRKVRHGFTAMPKAAFEDTRLTYEARGVLAYILVKPDGWKVHVSDLARKAGPGPNGKQGCGKDRIYRILDELKAAGYMTYDQGRGDKARFTTAEYTVTDTPVKVADSPDTGFPDAAQPDTDKAGAYRKLTLTKNPLETATDSDANASGEGTNGVPVAAPPFAHTNGSTQPEPLASPGLPSGAVNGAGSAGAGEPDASPAPRPRSARNGKASGSDAAQPDTLRAAESKLVFGELCTWLGLDWTRLPANTRGRLNKTTAALLDAGLGAAAVARARDAWRLDWRAKGGQVPDLSQVEGLVARAGAGLTASETPGHYPRYGVHDAPARVKMSEVF